MVPPDPAAFSATIDGQEVGLFHLDAGAYQAWICNFGAIVVSLQAPDRDGVAADVVLGCGSLADYQAGHPYYGCIAGRYANRIAGGRFDLDGQAVQLACNDGANHLHGGDRGFDKVVWQAEETQVDGSPALRLRHRSPAGDQGYPGTLEVEVLYSLSSGGVLRIDCQARSDAATIVNLTNHSYFNLSGDPSQSILAHQLQTPAATIVATDAANIPTGACLPVADGPFDFRQAKPLGQDIAADDQQLVFGLGYDHHFILDDHQGTEPRFAARLSDPGSGRHCELWTSDVGFQLYTGNHLDGTVRGKDGSLAAQRTGVCLEPQVHPDSPNHAAFPDPTLRPGETYHQIHEYRLSAD